MNRRDISERIIAQLPEGTKDTFFKIIKLGICPYCRYLREEFPFHVNSLGIYDLTSNEKEWLDIDLSLLYNMRFFINNNMGLNRFIEYYTYDFEGVYTISFGDIVFFSVSKNLDLFGVDKNEM